MLKVVDAEAVQWRDGDTYYVGRVQQCAGVRVWLTSATVMMLVKAEPTGERVFVDANCIKPYPSEPIPEPSTVSVGPVS